MKSKLCMMLGMMGAISFLMIKPSTESRQHSMEDQITTKSFVQSVYAKPGKGKDKGQKKGKDKGQKKGKDKDRGPSVPAIPMAAAVLIGLGGIGAGAYFIRKKKK